MHNSNFTKFVQREMDTISSSFCAAKWYNATIWLNHGKTVSCHHPAAHQIPLEEIKRNPSAIHNTEYKKQMRQQMVSGIRPPECKYCWDVEDMNNPDIFSDRVYKTIIHADPNGRLERDLLINTVNSNVNLRTLEISFDSTCNFACSYCSPTFSSTWQKLVRKHGPMSNIESHDVFQYQTEDGLWKSEKFKKDSNPYVEAFWKWWPELSTELKELRITGGEPLMSTDVWKLIDVITEHNKANRPIKLAINTNLGAKDDLIDRFIEAAAKLGENLTVYTSGEAYGKSAEFVRYGLEWDRWVKNCERLLAGPKLSSFINMGTVNALSFETFGDFCIEIERLKKKFPHQNIHMSANILKNPIFLQTTVLSSEIRNSIVEKFKSTVNISHWNQYDSNSVNRALMFALSKDNSHLKNDLRNFVIQFGQRAGLEPKDYLPKMTYDYIFS